MNKNPSDKTIKVFTTGPKTGFDSVRIDQVAPSIRVFKPKKINIPVDGFSSSSPFIPNNEIEKIDLDIRKNELQHQSSVKISSEKPVTRSVSNDFLSKLLIESNRIINFDNMLYIWDNSQKHYIPFINEYADKFIRQSIPDKYKNKITSQSIKEIVQWIKASDEVNSLNKVVTNTKSLVAFKNCLFNLDNHQILPHDSKYFFTSVICAKYPKKNNINGYHFERFLDDITGGNDLLYFRLQELFGYVISEVRDVKYIPYLLGKKDTGKSIILKIFEFLIGENNFTNLGFEQLNKPEYLAELICKRLNTCGETSEFTLNRLDILKKLSGTDSLMARSLYGSPIKFVNKAVLLFAGNHLPVIKGIDSSNAFSKRLAIFPFNNPIPMEKQDIQLFEKLKDEGKYIAKWSIEGLIRWQNNNYQFTTCPEVEKITRNYYQQNNSIESFIEECCNFDLSKRTYNCILEMAYHEYCEDIGIVPETTKIFHKHLKSLDNLKYSRFRIGSDNKYGYSGITLKNTDKFYI